VALSDELDDVICKALYMTYVMHVSLVRLRWDEN